MRFPVYIYGQGTVCHRACSVCGTCLILYSVYSIAPKPDSDTDICAIYFTVLCSVGVYRIVRIRSLSQGAQAAREVSAPNSQAESNAPSLVTRLMGARLQPARIHDPAYGLPSDTTAALPVRSFEPAYAEVHHRTKQNASPICTVYGNCERPILCTVHCTSMQQYRQCPLYAPSH